MIGGKGKEVQWVEDTLTYIPIGIGMGTIPRQKSQRTTNRHLNKEGQTEKTQEGEWKKEVKKGNMTDELSIQEGTWNF
jgi:hypothetical protein